MKKQQGLASLILIIFIVIIAFVCVMLARIYIQHDTSTLNNIASTQAFYTAEAGLNTWTTRLLSPELRNTPWCLNTQSDQTLANLPGTYDLSLNFNWAITATLTTDITATTTIIPVTTTAAYAPSGRIQIDQEFMDYFRKDDNNFYVVRGRGGSSARAHAEGAGLAENQCAITVTGMLPTINSQNPQQIVEAQAKRKLNAAVTYPAIFAAGESWELFQFYADSRVVTINSAPTFVDPATADIKLNQSPWQMRWQYVTPPGNNLSFAPIVPLPYFRTAIFTGISALNFSEAWLVGNTTSDGTQFNSAIIYRWDPVYQSFRRSYQLTYNNNKSPATTPHASDTCDAVTNTYRATCFNSSNPGYLLAANNNPLELTAISAVSHQEAWAVGKSANDLKYRSGDFTNEQYWKIGEKPSTLLQANVWKILKYSTSKNWCNSTIENCVGGMPNSPQTMTMPNNIEAFLTNPKPPSTYQFASYDLYGIQVIDSSSGGFGDLGYAVGGSTLLNGSCASGTVQKDPYFNTGHSLNYGYILKYQPRVNGAKWKLDAIINANILRAVFIVSAQEAWVVGDGGIIRMTNPSLSTAGWQTISSGTTADLYAITMLDPEHTGHATSGYAVGAAGTVLRYDGIKWSALTSSSTITFTGVTASDDRNVWVVGIANAYASGSKTGVIYHYDGKQWHNDTEQDCSRFTKPCQQMAPLRSIALVSRPQAYGWQEIFGMP